MHRYLDSAQKKVPIIMRMMKESSVDGQTEKPSFDAEIVKPILKRLVEKKGFKFIGQNRCEDIVDDMRKYLIHDLAKGKEEINISVQKENDEDVMHPFTYTPHNIPSKSIHIPIATTLIKDDDCCECKGDCLSSSTPCACARDKEFAYTREGLLSKEFLNARMKDEKYVFCDSNCPDIPKENKRGKCEGHLDRKFIKECYIKCGCTMQCANRVVQRGITRKIQVFRMNGGKGWGVRTLEKLPAGAFICEYAGEILTNNELYERNKSRSEDEHTYPVILDADGATERYLNDDEALCLDATNFGNVARFMNHRCFDGNMIDIPVQVETTARHYYHLAFFTTREVDALEELTWDYGIQFDDDQHPIKAFKCNCGSAYCRDKYRYPEPKSTKPDRKRRRGSANSRGKNKRQVKRGR